MYMPSLKEAAVRYAELGFAVFPLKPKDKEPATPHGFYDATKEVGTVEAWWIQNPDYNIGIATGQMSNLAVIDADVDDLEGKDGNKSIREWEKEHGELPETWTVITGRGGSHLWYRTAEDFGSSTHILPDVDIRANGGYVVAPPSIHPNGTPYEWDAMHDPDDYPISDLNGSARELLAKVRSRKKDDPDKVSFRNSEVIPSGHRQSALMSLIGSLKNLNMTDDSIKEAIRIENDARCDPPMSEEELEKEIFPFLRRDIDPDGDYADTVLPVNDITDYGLPEPVSMLGAWKNPPQLAPVLIDGVLRQGHKMIISGPSKAGKSYLLIELAYAIAEGMRWCNIPCAQGKVFYVNMEIDERSFAKRVLEVYKARGMNVDINIGNIVVWNLRGHSMPITELAPLIVEKTRDLGYRAIIVDPLYKVLLGDENSNSDVAQMAKGFDYIAQNTGCSVIYAHHFAKGYAGDKATIDRASGAGTFSRDPDAILTLTQLDIDADGRTAWRISFDMREFPDKKPVDVWWDYPVHNYDDHLENYEEISQRTVQAKNRKQGIMKQQVSDVHEAVKYTPKCDDHDGFTTTDFLNVYEAYEQVTRNTAETRLKNAGYRKETKVNGASGVWHKK